MTAWVTVSPRYASALRFSICSTRALISWAEYFLPSTSSVDHDVPMWRFTERIVRSGLVIAWRLATSPTRTSPFLAKATTEGVVRPPSALGMTVGSPPSRTLTTELVVPRSMPTALAMGFLQGTNRRGVEARLAALMANDTQKLSRLLSSLAGYRPGPHEREPGAPPPRP